MSRTILVIPCYNEARRLPLKVFGEFLCSNPGMTLLFVNDGSTDETLLLLERLQSEHPERVRVLDLRTNQGKAEAVRRGMLSAIEQHPDFAGYWDADLATPLYVAPEFARRLEAQPELEIVLGSRVQLLGRKIHRSPLRHYLGRIFATTASLLLDLRVYDTQCGAKLFRVNDALNGVFAERFRSRWIFDVEILVRYCQMRRGEGGDPLGAIYEEPLPEWRDVGGSKVKARDFLYSFFDLFRIYMAYRRSVRISHP